MKLRLFLFMYKFTLLGLFFPTLFANRESILLDFFEWFNNNFGLLRILLSLKDDEEKKDEVFKIFNGNVTLFLLTIIGDILIKFSCCEKYLEKFILFSLLFSTRLDKLSFLLLLLSTLEEEEENEEDSFNAISNPAASDWGINTIEDVVEDAFWVAVVIIINEKQRGRERNSIIK